MPVDVWWLLEHSALAAAMRGSAWLYPLVNIIHIVALLIFFAAVVAMDARLLGALRQTTIAAVLRPCRPIAAVAFVLQAASGTLLLSAEATVIVANPAFLAKMVVVALALANVAVLEGVWGRRLAALPAEARIPTGARLCAALSIAAWVAAAVLGRLIAYL